MGIDSSNIEANASLSGLVRRNTAESYRDYSKELARTAGVDPEARPAASPHTRWQENPIPAPHHAWYFTNFTPAGGNTAFSTD